MIGVKLSKLSLADLRMGTNYKNESECLVSLSKDVKVDAAREKRNETASLPEWSKGVVLRTTKRKLAWVRTPQLAFF